MNAEQWAGQAALVLANFHRAALAAGLAFFLITIIRKWPALGTLTGPVGQVLNASLGAAAMVEALFPMYWMVVKGRPISDIAAGWLEIYVYVGAGLMFLIGLIAVREALK